MAVQKKGVLGLVLGPVGAVSGYIRNGVNIIQGRGVVSDKRVVPKNGEIEGYYKYFLRYYNDVHSLLHNFLDFPSVVAIDTKTCPLTNYLKKGLGLKRQVIEVKSVSGFIGSASMLVVRASNVKPGEIRFNVYCDLAQFQDNEVVLLCMCVVSLKAKSRYVDYIVLGSSSLQFYNVYNNEALDDVFYVEVFAYGRSSGIVTNFTCFLTKLQV